MLLPQIIRGIAMGLALIMYGREEEAETLIEQMSRDQDPILRYLPCMPLMYQLAYCTASTTDVQSAKGFSNSKL